MGRNYDPMRTVGFIPLVVFSQQATNYLAKVHILVHTMHRGWPMHLEIGVILFQLPA
jgi:hypothetical protein